MTRNNRQRNSAQLRPWLLLAAFVVAAAAPISSASLYGGLSLPTAMEDLFMKNNRHQPTLLDAAKQVLEEALRRGYDRRASSAEFVHTRDLRLSLQLGAPDERATHALIEFFQIEDALAPVEEFRAPFLPEPDPAVLATGDLSAFETLGGIRVNYTKDEQPLQGRFFGRFGTGKTTAAYALADQNIARCLPVVVLDSKGFQFDALIATYPDRVIKLKVGRDAIINPMKYPDLATPLFARIYHRHDSEALLAMAAQELRRPSPPKKPCIVTLPRVLASVPRVHVPTGFPDVKPELRQSLLAPAIEIANSPLSISISCERDLVFAALIKAKLSVILDTSEIAGTIHEDYFLTSLLLNIREDIRTDPVLAKRHGHLILFLVDEATSIAASAKHYDRGLHPFCQLVTLCRGSGISVFLCYHSPSSVPELLLNAYIILCCNHVNGADIWALKKSMFLTDDQAQAVTRLPVGHGILVMAGRCDKVVVRWPDFPKCSIPSDAEVIANNSRLLALLPPIVPDTSNLADLFAAPTPPPSLPLLAGADQDILYLLNHIETEPFLNLTNRCKALRFPSGQRLNYRQLRAVLAELRKRSWVDYVEVQMSIRGGPGEFWFLTPDTRIRLFGSSRLLRGGVGSSHDLVRRIAHKILTDRSIKSDMEAWLSPTKQVDILCESPDTGKDIAIEICTSTFATEPDQALLDRAAGADAVISVAPTRSALDGLRNEFVKRFCSSPDPRITLAMPCHLAAAPTLRHVFDCPALVYDPRWDRVHLKINSLGGARNAHS